MTPTRTPTRTVSACQVCGWSRSTDDGLTSDAVDEAGRRHAGELRGRTPAERADAAAHPTATTTTPVSP